MQHLDSWIVAVVSVLLCLVTGIFIGAVGSRFLRRVRRAVSISFTFTVISLISILGISSGFSILISGAYVFLHIPMALIAALASGLSSVMISIAIESLSHSPCSDSYAWL